MGGVERGGVGSEEGRYVQWRGGGGGGWGW
jgi:hypothetical protein